MVGAIHTSFMSARIPQLFGFGAAQAVALDRDVLAPERLDPD